MRKSHIYLAFSILFLGIFVVICLVINLPNTFFYDLLRFFVSLLGIISFILYNKKRNEELDSELSTDIDLLRKKYEYLHAIVLTHTKLIYKKLCEEFIKKYAVSVDESDEYLITLENYLETFRQHSSNNKINNDFIVLSCVMNSLISNWKIKTSIPSKVAVIDDLVLLNCKLAVCSTLSLIHISYDELKDDYYIKKLIDILYLSYMDSIYGEISTIENEAMILELLFIELKD